jgi:hypothetical protein
VFGAFITGDHKWAVGLRHLVGRLTGRAGAAASSAYRNRSEQSFPWVTQHRTELAVLGAAVAVLWLLVADVTIGLLVVVLVLLAIYELGIYLLSARSPSSPERVESDAPATA